MDLYTLLEYMSYTRQRPRCVVFISYNMFQSSQFQKYIKFPCSRKSLSFNSHAVETTNLFPHYWIRGLGIDRDKDNVFLQKCFPAQQTRHIKCMLIDGPLIKEELIRCPVLLTCFQCSNLESCVWRAVSSHSSHLPQEVLLVQCNL